MASDNEASCVSDPNFSVICSFLECFGKSCGIDYPDIAMLQKMLEDTHEVPKPLIDLHIKLLRKTRKSVSTEKWERALVKFCHTYSNQDGWELERFGYKKARIGVKLRLLKVLLESQFDLNQKFKNEVNKLAAKELRVEPLGRDKTGLAYWFQLDKGCNIRVYREDLDEESWELVANDREGVVNLINTLSDGEIGPIPINEDSNSLEISEKPIIDTGQVLTSSPSVDEEGGDGIQENSNAIDSKKQIQLNNKNISNDDIRKLSGKKNTNKIMNESDNSEERSEDEDDEDEDEDEDEEELSNDGEEDGLKQNTEEEDDEDEEDEGDSQDTEGDNDETIVATVSKTPVNQLKKQIKYEDYTKHKIVAHEPVNIDKKIVKTSVIKPIIAEPTPIKSIETPVITTSPLKLVNISELKQTTNDRIPNMTISQPLSIIKSAINEESMSLSMKMHEKLQTKNPLPFTDPMMSHVKISMKPIDKLAANLVRMQSEKLEKPSASKLLEKIAENLARSSAHGSSVINGDDDKFLSDFSARNQPEKLNLLGNVRSSRGMDLSTSPRGWERANDYNRPMDFSGIDLSSRKTTPTTITKPTDLPSTGYRSQEFQYREMDLSTRKSTKIELPNLPYDSRTAILRNHTIVTDLSKRQMPFVNYDMPSVAAAAAYHSSPRIPGKEEHRLANYTILPDPSKLASMRSSAVKRPLESVDDPQQEILKRIRTDIMPMRSAIDKKSTLIGGMRRNDVGPAIEEPLMMVHGEGSGSDCDASNPEVGEAIEESVLFFYGEGNGQDCDTGNPGDETSTDNKDSNESKDENCSEISATISQTKVTDDNDSNNDNNAQSVSSIVTNATLESVKITSDCKNSNPSMTTTSNCQAPETAVTSEAVKIKFKPSLGVQVIVKSSSGPPIKRFSRWDVGGPEEKRECDSSIISNEENISSESNIDKVRCSSEKNTKKLIVNLPSTELKIETDAISSTTNQSLSQSSTSSLQPEDNKISTNSDFHCDSSSVEPMEIELTRREKRSELTEVMETETSQTDETDEVPRFFFGPNCVSYTPTTINKENIEQDATSSSTTHSVKLDTDENSCTPDNNDSTKSSDVPVAVSEPILVEADDGTTEEMNCDDKSTIESLVILTKTMDVSVDEQAQVDDNKEEDSNDFEIKMKDRNKEDIDDSKKSEQYEPSTTVMSDVPESSTPSSTYPKDERGEDESAKTSVIFDSESRHDIVTNSECAEVKKSHISFSEVTTVVESTSLTNEVCSTSMIDGSIEDNLVVTNEKVIDSSNVVEEPKIEPMETSNIDDKECISKAELDETVPQSTATVVKDIEDIIESNKEEQEQKVESSINDAPLHIELKENPEIEGNTVINNESSDISVMEPINESISVQDSSVEMTPSSSSLSVPKSPEKMKILDTKQSENDESQKNIDSTNVICDDISDDQSNSADLDSNESMVIDDGTSDFSKLTENFRLKSIENSPDLEKKIPDLNTLETNMIIEESTLQVENKCLILSSKTDSPLSVCEEDSKPVENSDIIMDEISETKKEDTVEKISIENISSVEKEFKSTISTMEEKSESVIPTMERESESVDTTIEEKSDPTISAVEKKSELIIPTLEEKCELVIPTIERESESVDTTIRNNSESVDTTIETESDTTVSAMEKESEPTISTMEVKSESIISTMEGESESVDTSIGKESDTAVSAMERESELIIPTTEKKSESVIPTMETESESVDSTMEKNLDTTISKIEKESELITPTLEEKSEFVIPTMETESESVDSTMEKNLDTTISKMEKESELITPTLEENSEFVIPTIERESESVDTTIKNESDTSISTMEKESELIISTLEEKPYSVTLPIERESESIDSTEKKIDTTISTMEKESESIISTLEEKLESVTLPIERESESIDSTVEKKLDTTISAVKKESDLKISTLEKESESIISTTEKEFGSIDSTIGEKSELIISTKEKESESVISTMKNKSESVISTNKKLIESSESPASLEASTLDVNSLKPSLISQTSLVANYDSNESNDTCSDDVFDAESAMEIDSQDVEESLITESQQRSKVSTEFSTNIKTTESEPATSSKSIENPSTIDTKIGKITILTDVKSQIDNSTLAKVEKMEEKSYIKTVGKSPIEEKPIVEFVKPVENISVDELKRDQINQKDCDSGKVEPIFEVKSQDTESVMPQPITEIFQEKSSESSKTKFNNLEIVEPEEIAKQPKLLPEDSPQKIIKTEEITRINLENTPDEMTQDISAFSCEYSGSNSPAYTDEDENDEEPPIIQISKRPRTDIEELNQNIIVKPMCMNELSNDKQILNETQYKDKYSVPSSIVAPMTKSDEYVKKLQIGEKPASTISDISDVPFIEQGIGTNVEKNECENLPSISMKKSIEESKKSLTVINVVTNIVDTIQKDITKSSDYEKVDIKKENTKRLDCAIESEDLPPLKSKSIDTDFVKEEPHTLVNDIKSTFNEKLVKKPMEIIDKTPTPAVGSINIITQPILLPEKKEMEIKGEEIHQVCSNNFLKIKQSNNESTEDIVVITDLSNSKPVGDLDESDDSIGVDNECMFEPTENNIDPLSIVNDDLTEEKMDIETTDGKLGIRVRPMNDIQYEGWKLDSTESMTPLSKVSRKRRNSANESNSEDGTSKQNDNLEKMTGGKRIKLRGKRTPDLTLRKSVEESRLAGASSDDETSIITETITTLPNPPETGEVKSEIVEATTVNPFKPKSKAKGRRRRGFRSKRRASRHKKSDVTSSLAGTTILSADGTPIDDASESTPTARKKRKKRKMVLGLEIGIDIALPDSQSAGTALNETPVRQSRRIAQIKIKEEADRRRIEEEALGEMKEKKERDTADKKKRKKAKSESDDDPPVKCDVRYERDVKLKKKRKKKKKETKFNEAKPWQSSSGSSTEIEEENEDLDDEEDIESEESLLFKSDHEFSPESDLEKDAETEPMRRARTAQKSENAVKEAEDEYACQKCGEADHPEWILLCDTCDKGWHCSCLRPALMLIPEGDWFCPPCQHNLLVNKLRDSLKTYDQLAKRHENEVLRKKRLAFVGISLDNVLQKNEAHRQHKSSRLSDNSDEDNDGDDDDDDDDAASEGGSSSSSSESSGSGSSESDSSSDESEPVYQLRERRCANTYKFNEYDDMINAAIQDEVEAVQGAGNQGRGKDISTIVNAEKEEAQVEVFDKQREEENDEEKQSEKDSDKEFSKDTDLTDTENQHKSLLSKKLLSRKKHRKLNSLDISSEDDPDSDEDFKGSSSDEEEDYEDQLLSSDDSSFTESRRRGKKNSRPVRRSTRAARKTRYDEDFINDDSDESDRPKRKKSKSTWDESESEESDNSWSSRKKRSRPSAMPRFRASAKSKSKKKKKRKRIIEPDNQSDNENEEEEANIELEKKTEEVEPPQEPEPIEEPIQEPIPTVEPPVLLPELPQEDSAVDDSNKIIVNEDVKEEVHDETPAVEESKPELPTDYPIPPPVILAEEVEKKKEHTPKLKKTPTIRRKIIYGGLPDERPSQDEEPLGRRTRGRKINYQVDTIMSDSEEELKKALRKTEESEDEFVVNEGDEHHEEGDKDSDSGDIYSPKKDTPKGKYKSPKNRRIKRSPGGKSMTDNGEPKQRKKPGPKPGSKNKPRMPKTMMTSLEGGVIGDVAEGSLASLGTGELAELDDEQLEQMMMEDEEYGRRQLELAAIEIAKNKKKEEREAKKLEKARLKALEILAAEQQRDPNAPEGTDSEVPKKKKRGRRSKAEILADQMRRDGAPHLGGGLTPSPNIPTIVPPSLSIVNPVLSSMPVMMMPSDAAAERPPVEGQMPMITGPDGQLFNPDGTPVKPKRRGRGKGKKTLALEAARAAEAAAKAAAEARGLGLTGADVNSELKPDDIPNVLPTPGSSTSGSAPSTPPAIAVTSQGLPVPPSSQSSNPQSVYPQLPSSQQSSVITRMLQSQPVSTAPQSFTAAAAAMGQKYFGIPNAASQMMGGPRSSYDMSSRGRIPSPYNSRQPGQPPMPPHFAAVRSGTPPMRMRVPGPTQLYHTPHHPMDPSPSGGGPISISNRDRASPLGPGPAMIPPAAGSPLAKGGPTPPPYVRGGPPLSRFTDNPQLGSRHQLPPFTSASPANHSMQQPSPPPNRPPGNFSPYHPQPPPNYHYGAYPPPAPMPTADDAAAYQGSPYSAEHFSTSSENPPPIQPPTPQSQSQSQAPPPPPPPSQQHPSTHTNEAVHGPVKQYDEEGTGEFGGLVSYFSSQREDDLDS